MFFRVIPDKGGFAITAGLEQVIRYMQSLKFTEEDIEYLRSKDCFSEGFLAYLKNFHFECDVWAIPEGTPVFPYEPIVTVRGPVIQAQFLETMVLLLINHQSLIATKASRIVRAAKGRPVMVFNWLTNGSTAPQNELADYLKKLDDFDLNEYIKAIHFDMLKVPSVPFQFASSRSAYGIKQMMDIELDFIRAVVLSKSTEDVISYSDMPIEEMSRDKEFPKKWMYGMALMLKKGLHINMIHNINRPFSEMMLGLESWVTTE